MRAKLHVALRDALDSRIASHVYIVDAVAIISDVTNSRDEKG